MVKKLFKHEFLFYGRIMPIIYAILLIVAVATSVIFIFANDTTTYYIVSGFSEAVYGFSVIAAFGFAFVMGIVRFYKNLFTSEGYLTLTLPVTATQHIMVKAITAVSVNLITGVMVLISVFVVYGGKNLTGVLEGLDYIFGELFTKGGIHTVLIGGELVIMLLVASFTSIMLYYTFISIGQLFKKNRILAAVGAYFVYYIIMQIVSTVLSVFLVLFASSGMFEDLGFWIINHPVESVHIALCGSILLSVISAMIEFIVIRTIITKKLNLE